MADFPSFGNANRQAPLNQKAAYPNIQFAVSVNDHANYAKTALVAISIVNLNTQFVAASLDRIFAYALESGGNELNSSPILEQITAPTIHFEIDITSVTTQVGAVATNPGTGIPLEAATYRTVRTANIDILIENLQIPLLAATLQRIKTYMSSSISADLNP